MLPEATAPCCTGPAVDRFVHAVRARGRGRRSVVAIVVAMVSAPLAAAAALLVAAGALVAHDAATGRARTPDAVLAVDAPDDQVRYRWPSDGPAHVLRAFDPPAAPWETGHRGVDLGLAAGSPVVAAADGRVAFAGRLAGRGVVSVQHADGLRTTYEPVAAVVRAGEAVSAGAVLGRLEPTGSHCGPQACLHWGARRGPREYVDPLTLLRDAVVRLYPEP